MQVNNELSARWAAAQMKQVYTLNRELMYSQYNLIKYVHMALNAACDQRGGIGSPLNHCNNIHLRRRVCLHCAKAEVHEDEILRDD